MPGSRQGMYNDERQSAGNYRFCTKCPEQSRLDLLLGRLRHLHTFQAGTFVHFPHHTCESLPVQIVQIRFAVFVTS